MTWQQLIELQRCKTWQEFYDTLKDLAEREQPGGVVQGDLVQVVRCRSCQWWRPLGCTGTCTRPPNGALRIREPDFYCAAGVAAKKEETT